VTGEEWLDAADRFCREADGAGILPQTAAASALRELLDSWIVSFAEGISPRVMVHDLKEVAHALLLLHDELERVLPNVLQEMAEIPD
jgi:hypothetical protein